jgi:uncharacterized protein YbbC (DUF1343 family)
MTCKPEAEKVIYQTTPPVTQTTTVVPASERIAVYHPLLANKKVALVVNQTSIVKGSHLVDTLLKLGVNIKVIFAPEHGFRGKADAGEVISDTKDTKTGLPIISIYGKKKKTIGRRPQRC